MYSRTTRSASMFLKEKRARSPDLVEMPESGCLGTRSVGKAAMNSLLGYKGAVMRMFLMLESYVPAMISKKWWNSAGLLMKFLG